MEIEDIIKRETLFVAAWVCLKSMKICFSFNYYQAQEACAVGCLSRKAYTVLIFGKKITEIKMQKQ